MQQLLDPGVMPRELVNPMTAEMDVMRTNLWPGLVNVLLYNKSRQQHRVRLFETGLSFLVQGDEIKQEQRLAGLMSGHCLPEQWGASKREVDFYDIKGVVERVLSISLNADEISWLPETHPALHPGQAAGIYCQGKKIGLLGCLSPVVTQTFDLKDRAKIYVFELELAPLLSLRQPLAAEISKFPEIRRDIALMIKDTVPALAIQDTIRSVAGDWLKDVFIFDVYQGKGISPGLKSVALGLVLQHPARTLVDDEVNALIERVTTALKGQLGAELRS
jgi:phenylalanyl-tRNA synthetase beta chain